MPRALTTLALLTILTACPTPAWSEFTQADRERMIQMITKIEEMDKRFDQMDKRLDDLRTDTNQRLEEQRTDTNQRFAELREDMNARFAQVDKQFTTLTNLMIAIIAAFVAIVVMAVSLALWDRRTMLRPVEEKTGKLEKLLVDHMEPRLQECEGKVETVTTQSTQSAEAEAVKRKRMRDALDDLQSRGGDDARLAGVLRGLL